MDGEVIRKHLHDVLDKVKKMAVMQHWKVAGVLHNLKAFYDMRICCKGILKSSFPNHWDG